MEGKVNEEPQKVVVDIAEGKVNEEPQKVVVDIAEGKVNEEPQKVAVDIAEGNFWERLEKDERIPESLRRVPWTLIFGILLWWSLNCIYVIQNKAFLNVIPLQWTCSGMQLILGAILSGLSWACRIREIPRIVNWRKAMFAFIPLGICHLLVHYGAVISMGFGAVSFTQVVKAGEPMVTAILSMIFLREFLNIYAYLSLIPVIVGISLASAKELDFSIKAFMFAMLSNIGGSCRSIIAKVTMKNKIDIGENLTGPNIYMILTVISGILSIPIVLLIEFKDWKDIWEDSTAAMTSHEKGIYILRAFIAALCYYIYNDFAFYCLGRMNQVTHSVVNTLKRVLVIVVSIIIFRNPISLLGGIGMALAVSGGCLYSLAKQGIFVPKKKQEAESKKGETQEKGEEEAESKKEETQEKGEEETESKKEETQEKGEEETESKKEETQEKGEERV